MTAPTTSRTIFRFFFLLKNVVIASFRSFRSSCRIALHALWVRSVGIRVRVRMRGVWTDEKRLAGPFEVFSPGSPYRSHTKLDAGSHLGPPLCGRDVRGDNRSRAEFPCSAARKAS